MLSLQRGLPERDVVIMDDAASATPATFGGPYFDPEVRQDGGPGRGCATTVPCDGDVARHAGGVLTGRNPPRGRMGGIPQSSRLPSRGYSAMLPRDAVHSRSPQTRRTADATARNRPNGTDEPKVSRDRGPFNHWPNAWGIDLLLGVLAPEAEPDRHDDPPRNQQIMGLSRQGREALLLTRGDDRQAISDGFHGAPGVTIRRSPGSCYYSTGCSHAPPCIKGVVEKDNGSATREGQAPRGNTSNARKRLGGSRPTRR